jgi:hypothetical protein
MNVVERVEGRVPVALGGSVVVGRQEGMGRGKVGPRALSKPANRTYHALVSLLAFEECRTIVGFVGFRAGVDGEAGAVGSSVGGDVAHVNGVVLYKVGCETGLAEMDRDLAVVTRPLEMSTQEPVHGAHEVDGDEPCEELLESTFDFRIFQEIDKVVHVQPYRQGGGGGVVGGVGGVAQEAGKHAGIRRVGLEANAAEDGRDLIVPVAGTSAETIKWFSQEPIFVLGSVRVSNRRLDNSDFVVGENSLAEGILAVALFESASLFDREADHETQRVGAKDGGIFF